MEWLSLQVFDVLPLYGVLQPHSSHQISFTFYGHCDIIAQAKALCQVEGGPIYEIILRGEASLVNYSFDTKDINYGLQVLPAIWQRFSGFALNTGHGPWALISPGTSTITVSPSHLFLIPNLPPQPWSYSHYQLFARHFHLLFSLSPEIQYARCKNSHLPSQSRIPFQPLRFFQWHYYLLSPLSLWSPRHFPLHSLLRLPAPL